MNFINLLPIFFSGSEPYPNINNEDLVGQLKLGYRIERPNNCPDPMFVLYVLFLFHFLEFFSFLLFSDA